MTQPLVPEHSPAERLPLPLAMIHTRAVNAKSALDRHNSAYYLWEAGLKLLGSVAVVAYAEGTHHDAAPTERLRNLARPSLGHWWELVRVLLPKLAETSPAFEAVRGLLLGPARDDLPRLAGLDAALREALDGKSSARSTVKLSELFDRLVQYRNREFGHGAAGQKSSAHYDRLGRAFLAGVVQLWSRVEVLVGHRLVYIAEVRRRGDGSWLVERRNFTQERERILESFVVANADAGRLPFAEQLYLEMPSGSERDDLARMVRLHPLVAFEAEPGEVLFLNARRGKARVEYLSYTSGRIVERADLVLEQRELLRRVLDVPSDQIDVAQWAAASAADEVHADGSAPEEMPHTRLLGDYSSSASSARAGWAWSIAPGSPR